MIGGFIGSVVLWASTNSLERTVEDADGYIGENLKYIGWDDPPEAIATTAADNVVSVFAIIFIILGVLAFILWGIEKVMTRRTPNDGGESTENPYSPNKRPRGIIIEGLRAYGNGGAGISMPEGANVQASNLDLRDNKGGGIEIRPDRPDEKGSIDARDRTAQSEPTDTEGDKPNSSPTPEKRKKYFGGFSFSKGDHIK